MFLDDCESSENTRLLGFATLADEVDRAEWAEVARNCEFLLNNQVAQRRGFGGAFLPLTELGFIAMTFWLKTGVPYLLYAGVGAAGRKVVMRNLVTGAQVSVGLPLATDVVDLTVFGSYFAICSGVAGVFQQVSLWDGTNTQITAFNPPPAFTYTITEPIGVGHVTAGEHFFAVVFTTVYGYETRPGPLKTPFGSSGSFGDLELESFIAAGAKKLSVRITPTLGLWPATFVSAALLMTPVINPGRYFFVPGCTAIVPVGTGFDVVFPDVDISDVILSATASKEAITPQRNYFALYSQDSNFLGPFTPYKTLAYSNRAVYLTTLEDGTAGAFISEQNAYQWITLAFHLVQLPDRRDISTAFVLRGALYFLGPNWTYASTDNNAQPVSWAPAQEIDGRIGTSAVRGVDANSSLGYAWVAHVTGLYLFNQGYYASRPVTYLIQSVWDRINWSAAKNVIVKDFPDRKIAMVFVPLDSGQTARNAIVVDYTNGATWDKVNCSVWSILGGNRSLELGTPFGAAELVINPDKGNVTEMWLGPAQAGAALRSKSVSAGDTEGEIHDDGETAGLATLTGVAWEYRTMALPKVFREVMNYAAVSPRIRGNGTITAVASTLDHKYTQDLSPVTAEAAPGEWPLLQMDVQAETLHVEFTNYDGDGIPVVGAWALIASIKTWWTKLWTQRG